MVVMRQLTLELQPLDQLEIKQYRWITLQEQKDFSEFLDKVGFSEYQEDLACCAKRWQKFRCQNDNGHSKVVRYVACGRRGICPRCSMSYAHKRAGIMYAWIKRNIADKLAFDFDLKMNQIVLTLPKELHTDIDVKVFAKMVKSFMTSLKIEGYGYCIQDRHSRSPLSERYVHAHVLSLNVKQEDNRLVKTDYYFDVENMRQIWKDVIKKFTGHDVEGAVNVHTEYASVLYDKQKVLHLLAYVYRYPIQDLFQVQTRDKTINYLECEQIEKNPITEKRFCISCYEHIEPDDKEKLAHCRFLGHRTEGAWDTITNNILQIDLASKIRALTQSKPRFVWCGLLTSVKRELLQNLIGVGTNSWKNLVDIEKDLDSKSKNCRDCGCPLEEKPYDTGWYEGDNEPK